MPIDLPGLVKPTSKGKHVPLLLVKSSDHLLFPRLPSFCERRFQERQRLLISGKGFCMRIHSPRSLRCPLVVADSLLNEACLFIVGCDLSTDPLYVVLIHCFERLSHPLMELTSPCRARAGVCYLTQFVVTEVVGIQASRDLLTHNASLPQFVQAAYQFVFIVLASLC